MEWEAYRECNFRKLPNCVGMVPPNLFAGKYLKTQMSTEPKQLTKGQKRGQGGTYNFCKFDNNPS